MTSAPFSGPLAGRRVLITRRWPEVAQGVAALGGHAAEVPLITVAPPADPGPLEAALGRLTEYDWLVFTSANAVEAVAARLSSLGAALPDSVRLASVGPATTDAILGAWPGARVEVQPQAEFRGASLVEAFAGHDLAGRRVLLPVSDRAAATVERGLSARRAQVDRVVAYRAAASSSSGDALVRAMGAGVDAVVFASPSAVEAFSAALGASAGQARAVVIGPTTAEAASTAGLAVLAVAEPSTPDGLLRALVRVLAPGDLDGGNEG